MEDAWLSHKWRNQDSKPSQKSTPNLTGQNLTRIPLSLTLKFKKTKGRVASGGETAIVCVQGLVILCLVFSLMRCNSVLELLKKKKRQNSRLYFM